jgi:ABC-2 type transporter
MPQYINPAEFILEQVSTDFIANQELADSKLQDLVQGWEASSQQVAVKDSISELKTGSSDSGALVEENDKLSVLQHTTIPLTLVHRNFIKSYRDVIAYGIRIAMYLGLAIMMGTVWLRLAPQQKNIESFTNAIFYGGAFMSFMAVSIANVYKLEQRANVSQVAYIPSYLEDRTLYIKERGNGLYGPTAFMISNFIIGLPFLCK